ncbi:MAG: 16S rRNA (adenine(1518)-N(6)/adenine(1519)-N(6))-dimethyltransferase RsmA [Bacteroidota bacterium]|nr:16S rRNA (adenine(1518)-N(6)/adenine(1519)-N(6))-dimethyltransferase RsmA [Bacteroidota bacterium]
MIPKKRLGQHFLNDDNIAAKIAGSFCGHYKTIVEVGPGTGALSKFLLNDDRFVPYFFEIDPEAVSFLEKKFPEIKDKIILSDFLEADLSFIPAPFGLIGNFPYNIGSQILFRVLEYRDSIPEVVGMFQKEFAERIASKPGTRESGILSILLQAYYSIEYLFTVSENVFFPKPKVKSAVIRMKRNEVRSLDCDEKVFQSVVKQAFNQRRKTLRNALRSCLPEKTDDIADLLQKRAEQLTIQDFIRLAKNVSPNGKIHNFAP